MDIDKPLPRALKIVAALFVLGGILAVIEVAVSLMQNRLSLNFGVLGFFIGAGLLRLSRGWRTCALVCLWFGLILLPIIFLLGLLGTLPAYLQIFGVRVARVPGWTVSGAAIPFFLLVLWEYRVLVRADIRSLFGLG